VKVASLFIAFTIPFFLLTVWALVDISMKKFPTIGEKAAWWVITILPFFGWLVYLMIGFRRGVKAPEE
jgi:hypothetical protein